MAASLDFVKGLYAAFSRGEIGTIVNACAPDLRWDVKGRQKDYPTIGVWKGPAGVAEFFKRVGAEQNPIAFSPNEFHVADDTVIVFGNYKWTVRKTGKVVDADFVHVFTVKDGKIVGFREFTDTAQFAEAWKG